MGPSLIHRKPWSIHRKPWSELWECGNREAISKDGGKGGKPDLGFPGFPRPGISTAQSFAVRFGSFLLLFGRPTEAIRFGAGLQNMSAVGDAIQQCFAEPRIGNDLRPF